MVERNVPERNVPGGSIYKHAKGQSCCSSVVLYIGSGPEPRHFCNKFLVR